MTEPQAGRIFISYRRADSAGYAGRLYDRLAAHFGKESIFMDVDTIQAGLDFVDVLENAVQSCDVLVALMGRQWLNITGEDGKRRLDNPQDFVRIELAAALNRGIRVIPVLLDGTSMPNSGQLPNDLELLARRNAVPVTHQSFHNDANRLIEQLELALKAAEESRILKATKETPQVSQTVFQALNSDGRRIDSEYSFITQTAIQANNDRARLSSYYYWIAFGSFILIFFFTQLFDPEIFTSSIKLMLSGLFIIVTIIGTSTIIKSGQLHRTWDKSVLAISQLGASNTIFSKIREINNSDNQAVEIGLTSGLSFSSAMFFLQSAFFPITIITWLMSLFLGIITHFVQMKIYKRQQRDLPLETAEGSKIFKATDENSQVSQALDTDGLLDDTKYNFIAQIAMQANKDRARLSYYSWIAVGSFILIFLFTQLLDPAQFTSSIKLMFSGLFIIETLIGTSTIIKSAQFRKIWDESISAMHQFKKSNSLLLRAKEKTSQTTR